MPWLKLWSGGLTHVQRISNPGHLHLIQECHFCV